MGEHVGLSTENCHVQGDKGLIATIGVKDLVIMRMGKTLVVCQNNKASVEELIAKLKEEGYGRRTVVKELQKLLNTM